MLPQVDLEGQQRLLESHVLIIGLGGLGAPVALYLAAAGVGRLTLADGDVVDLTNLQRQVIHGQADIGRAKVSSAAKHLRDINPEVRIDEVNRRLTAEDLAALVPTVDVVVDGSDNFATRFSVNGACVEGSKPLVSGAVIRMEGQLAVFRADQDDAPCYRCIFPEAGETEERCAETGVLAPLPGVIGSLQAVETLKILLGQGAKGNRLQLYNAASGDWRTLARSGTPPALSAGHPSRKSPGQVPGLSTRSGPCRYGQDETIW